MSRAIYFLLLTAMFLTMATSAFCATADDYFNRGNAKQAKGETDRAIADFTKAIQLKPDFWLAYYHRGLAKQATGDFDGAIADFTKTIQLEPDYPDAYNSRGLAKQAKGDHDGAIADFTETAQRELLRDRHATAKAR